MPATADESPCEPGNAKSEPVTGETDHHPILTRRSTPAAALLNMLRFCFVVLGLWCFYCALRNITTHASEAGIWFVIEEEVILGAVFWGLACCLRGRRRCD